MNSEKVEEFLKELIRLDNKILNDCKNLNKNNFESLYNTVVEFADVKRELRLMSQIDLSTIKISDPYLRNILIDLQKGKKVFKSDKFIKFFNEMITNNLRRKSPEDQHPEIDLNEITFEEMDIYGDHNFDAWMSRYDYIEGLLEVQALIVNVSIPDKLDKFVNEARNCFAFQQYNATYSLCRTILETAMCDIGIRKGKIHRPDTNSRNFYYEYPPKKLMEIVSEKGWFKKRIRDFYSDLSSLIHGYKTADRSDAINVLRKTLDLVQELYEHNSIKFKPESN